jgi:hypothetical protein
MGSAASAPHDGGSSGQSNFSSLPKATSLSTSSTARKNDTVLPINNASSSSSLSGPKNGDDQDLSKQQQQQQQQHDKKNKKKKNELATLSGPAWVEAKCKGKKKAWQHCVGGWYDQRFLNGAALENETASDFNCDDLFEKYKACYVQGMAKQLERSHKKNNSNADGSTSSNNTAIIKPGSLLDEYLQETTTTTTHHQRQPDEKRQ